MPVIIPYVPEFITVHLGAPNSDARNVTVAFPDYIKNVASSEIYPTWSQAAITANIYAQISFALNRVYLEYYPSRGYDFQITNSTAYDQSFQEGRNIFDNIGQTVDEIFNNYIRRIGVAEPLAAKYCNGTTVTCQGLSQWGSEELASQGYSSFEILKYYYGDDIEIVTNAPISGIQSSYPGTPLRRGSTGPNVQVIQVSLNRISQDYPAIPKVNPVNGVFGEQTEESVKQFQRIFNLTSDGIVGKSTWYKLVFLYVGVNRLAELESEGQRMFSLDLQYPDAISEGDMGEKVVILQYFLSILSEFYTDIPFLTITGTFDETTKNAVLAFQKNNNLPQNGIVGETTWDEIYRQVIGAVDNVILEHQDSFINTRPFPGTVLKLGDRGDDVVALQQYLNTISLNNQTITPIAVDGIFGENTRNAVIQFQTAFGLPQTGEVDQATWTQITSQYTNVVSAITTSAQQYPGFPLKSGMNDGTNA